MNKATYRLLAYSIDFIILSVVLVGIQLFLNLVTNGFPFSYFSKSYQIYIWVLCTISIPAWFYFILLEISDKQSTLGKRFFNLKVTNKQSAPIGIKESFVRTLIRFLPWEITHISLLGIYFVENSKINMSIWISNILILIYVITIFITRGNLTIHDYFSRTKAEF